MLSQPKILTVYTSGAPVLEKSAEPVVSVTPEIKALAADMVNTMYAFDGIGLAAPQVGVSLRLVVIDVPIDDKKPLSPGEELLGHQMPIALVNPQIVKTFGNASEYDEGCLSVPGIYATVVRPERVLVRFSTLAGQNIEIECGNLLARCLQHEIDHLDGIVFTDRLAPAENQKIAADLAKLREQGRRCDFRRPRKR